MANVITLEFLKAAFPKVRANQALTGNIPIEWFDTNEGSIRETMKQHGLKAIYRGPRLSNKISYGFGQPSMTRRCDADSVLLYRKT
jgi:hypothetical protein